MTSEFGHAQWYADYKYRNLRILCDGKQCTAYIHATRQSGTWNATAWSGGEILTVPDKYNTVISDMHAPTSDRRICFQIADKMISVRPVENVTIANGMWFSGVLSWPVI